MKILAIIHSLDGGGAERVLAQLVTRLADRGHDVVLVTLDDAMNDRHDVSDRVRRQPLDLIKNHGGLLARVAGSINRVRTIRRVIKSEAPDVVLSFCDRMNIDTLISTKYLGVPVVISERSDPRRQKLGRFLEYARRRTYRRASRIVVLTEEIADALRPFNRDNVVVIASAVEPAIRSIDAALNHSKEVVLGVGRLEDEKGFDRLLEAFAIATRMQHRDWCLRIVGEGSQRAELVAQAKRLGIIDRTEFPGWIRPIWPEYQSASIFVLPSRYEGFPSALLEAMSVGLPSIAFESQSGSKELLGEGKGGVLVAEDVNELASAIKQLIEDPSAAVERSTQARDIAARYDWHSMVDAYESVLMRACQRT